MSGGNAWITQYGDLNDYVVHEGNWEAKSDGLVLVHALQFSLVDVTLPAGAKAQLRRRGELQRTTAEIALARAFHVLRLWFAFA